MKTPEDNHSVTASPLMSVEFIIIHTIIWSFLLCIAFYFFDFLLSAFSYLPVIGGLRYFFFEPPLYYFWLLLEWPQVMPTALIITIIRCILRHTRVTLSDDKIIIARPWHTDCLFLTDFIRPLSVETNINIHFIGWVFRRRYLLFQNTAGKEVKYRLYEFSEKDLEQVMQLITRVNHTEHLDEVDKTQIMMNAFQNALEISLDPRRIRLHTIRPLAIIGILSLLIFAGSSYLFYQMLHIPPQYDTGSALLPIIGFGSILFSLFSFLVLAYTLWTLIHHALRRKTCPRKISFAGNMLQVDHTIYSVNRIRQVIMNHPARKPNWLGCYQITIIDMEGTHRYWLGSSAGLDHNTWRTLCRNMQSLLISCPARLVYT